MFETHNAAQALAFAVLVLNGQPRAAMKLDRGQPTLFMAYWLWAAVYLFAVVANGVAAGPDGVACTAALCMPAALAAVPGVVSATEAWCDAFNEDFRAQYRQDRRCSNNGGHKAENMVVEPKGPVLRGSGSNCSTGAFVDACEPDTAL